MSAVGAPAAGALDAASDVFRARALVVTNVQNDFFQDGSMPVPGAEAIIPVINTLRKKGWTHVFVTGLHRPPDHCSFTTNRPASILGEFSVDGVAMVPDICVQGSWGSAFRAGLSLHETDVVVFYGFEPNVASMSLFSDRSKNVCSLQYVARELELEEIYFAGLTLDGAVLESVLDACAELPSVGLFVVEDACAGTTPAATAVALKTLESRSISIVQSTGMEISKIPEVPLELGVDLPVQKPAEDECHVAIVARIAAGRFGGVGNKERRLSIDVGSGPSSAACDSGNRPERRNSVDEMTARAITSSREHGAEVDPSHSDKPAVVPLAAPKIIIPTTPSRLSRSRSEKPGDTSLNAAAAPRMVRAHSDVLAAFSVLRSVPETPAAMRSPVFSPANGIPLSPVPFARSDGGQSRRFGAASPHKITGRKSFIGIVSRAQALRARSALQTVEPEHLIQIAMFGSPDDLSNTFLRFGTASIDTRVDPYGWNCLHFAVRRNSVRMVEVLLENGANVNQTTTNGSTPLLIACKFNATDVARILLRAAIRPATLNARDTEQGMTALLWACVHCSVELVQLLLAAALQYRVPLTTLTRTTDRFGHSPLMMAFAACPARLGSSSGDFFSTSSSVPPADSSTVLQQSSSDARDRSADPRSCDDKSRGTLFVAPANVGERRACLELLRSLTTALTAWPSVPRSDERLASLRRACDIIALLLSTERVTIRRAAMLIFASTREDCSQWTALHFGARSGALAFFDWGSVGDEVLEIDLNLTARSSATPLQLAAWNGKAATLSSLLGPWPGRAENLVARRIRLNEKLATPVAVSFNEGLTELDLAIVKQHYACSRLLCRAGGVTRECAGSRGSEELLYRTLLLGDGLTAERLLFSDVFDLKVSAQVVELVARIRHPGTCTYVVAQAHNPLAQYLFECASCNQVVCAVCQAMCHPCEAATLFDSSPRRADSRAASAPVEVSDRKFHESKALGFTLAAHCSCDKSTCRALGRLEPREAAGFTWVPVPIDTRGMSLDLSTGSELGQLVESLASNSHEVWSRDRIAAGWKWGAKRDDRKKLHPQLLAYSKLSDTDKQWDRDSARQTIAVIHALGYHMQRSAGRRQQLVAKATRVGWLVHGRLARAGAVLDPVGKSPAGATPVPLVPTATAAVDAASRLPVSPPVPPPLLPLTASISAVDARMPTVGLQLTGRSQSADDGHLDDDFSGPLRGRGVGGSVDDAGVYVPQPIDTAGITLSPDLDSLVELLAKNSHTVWAAGKRKAGWSYAPAYSAGEEANKTSPMLVPYEHLDDKEKDLSRKSAKELVKAMRYFGFTIDRDVDQSEVSQTTLRPLPTADTPAQSETRKHLLASFKQGVANTLLISAARLGQHSLIAGIIAGSCGVPAQINTIDSRFGRSPIFWAVERRHRAVVKLLVHHGASLELQDGNHMTVLTLAALLGDSRLVELLVDSGAPLGSRDLLGLTPLHYAAYMGHERVVSFLAERVPLHAPGMTVDFKVDAGVAADASPEAWGRTILTSGSGTQAALPKQPLRRGSRRASLMRSVHDLLAPRSRAASIDVVNLSLLEVTRLVNIDASQSAALDPLTLSGFHLSAGAPLDAASSATEVFRQGAQNSGTWPARLPRRSGMAVAGDRRESLRLSRLSLSGAHLSTSGGASSIARLTVVPLHSGLGWSFSTPAAQRAGSMVDATLGLQALPGAILRQAAGIRVPYVSPLTLAVHARRRSVAEILLRLGADATSRDGSDLSPYERALLQHAISSRVCDSLRSAHGPGVNSTGYAANTASWFRVPFMSPDKREDAAAKRAEELIEKELLFQLAPVRGLPALGQQQAHVVASPATRKTAVDIAAELDIEVSGKPSRWDVLRSRLPDVIRIGSQPIDPQVRVGAPSVSHKRVISSLSPESQIAPSKSGADAPRFDSSRGPGSRLQGHMPRSERDRLARLAARERAREKALRLAQVAESDAGSIVDCLGESSSVQNRRWAFAMTTLGKEVLWFLMFLLLFVWFTPLAPDYNGPVRAAFISSLKQSFAPFISGVQGPNDWQSWVDHNLLWIPPGATANVSDSTSRRRAEAFPAGSSQPRPEKRIFEAGDSKVAAFVTTQRYLRQGWIDPSMPRPVAASAPEPAKESFDAPARSRLLEDVIGGPVILGGEPSTAIIWNDPLTSTAAFRSTANDPTVVAPMVVGNSIVVGAVRIRATFQGFGRCAGAVGLRNAPAVCRAPDIYVISASYVQEPSTPTNEEYKALSNGDGLITDLDSADVSARRKSVDPYRSGSLAWNSSEISSLSIDFTVYNPTYAVFGAVRLFTYLPALGSGSAAPEIIIRTASLLGTRFQPSVIFEVVVVILTAVQLLHILRSSGGRLRWLFNGWNLVEAMTWLLFMTVLFFDIANLSAARALDIDLLQAGRFYDVWDVAGAIRSEVDLISALYYTLVIRALRYARLIPSWGPVLMAILSTIFDRAVVMYVTVLLVMLLTIAVSQFVAFSADNAYFSSLSTSFNSLFAMTFAQQFQIFSLTTPRIISTLYFALFALIATMLLNLLIGVVTEAYMDRARVQSTQQWEAHITQLMEESVASSRAAILRTSWLARLAQLAGPCSCRRGGTSPAGAAPPSPRGHRSAPGSLSPRLGTDIPSPRRPSKPGGGGGGACSDGGSSVYSAIAASQGAMEDPGIVLFAVLRDHCAELGGEEHGGPRSRGPPPPPRESRRGRSSVASRGGRSSSSSASSSSGGPSDDDGGGGRSHDQPPPPPPRHRTSSPASRRHHHHHHRGSRRLAPSCEACGGDKGQSQSSSLDRGFDALERRLGEQEASLNEVRRLLAQAVLALERRAEPEPAPQRRPPSIKFPPPALPAAAALATAAPSSSDVAAAPEVAPRTPQSEAGPPSRPRASLPGRGGRGALTIVVPEPPVEALAEEDGGGDDLPPPAGEAAGSAHSSPAVYADSMTPPAALSPASETLSRS